MEEAVIVDVDATPSRISLEVDATETMIERLFAEAKSTLALDRLRLRGLSGAREEFLLTAIVQNLKRLARHVIRPPPEPMTA